MLDFSRKTELTLHAEVLRDVHAAAEPLGLSPLIVGAFARDLLLTHAHGIVAQRATQDVDLAIALPGWDRFEQLRARLLDGGRFAVTDQPHRLRHRAMPLDLVPFGSIETPERKIAWPPEGAVTMDAFGFEEARRAAVPLMLPLSVLTAVVSLPALALLKIVCWNDRHTRSPLKDAADLDAIIANYLAAGNPERLWGEFVAWTQDDGFDWETAGARMLGHDMARLIDDDGRARIVGLLAAQLDDLRPGTLTREMRATDEARARVLLASVNRGLLEAAR